MEALRPRSLDAILGQPAVIARLKRLAEGVREGRIVTPHLLMHGPPGVGKTTAARAFGREVLGEHYENSFHLLNASDERGAERLRNQIVPDSLRPPSRQAPIRILFFDEADRLTPEAQAVLRPALEAETSSTVFILACNELDRVAPPIRSRCVVLEFAPVGGEEMRRIVAEAVEKTPFRLPPAELAAIAEEARGIPREAMKLLLEAGAIEGRGPGGASRPDAVAG